MVGGLMQYWHKDAPMGLMRAFYQQHRRTGFSQSLPASADGLQKFCNWKQYVNQQLYC
jgi:hypothetical protein